MLSYLKAEMDTLASTYRTTLSHRAFVTFRVITAIIINQYLLCVHGMPDTVPSVLHRLNDLMLQSHNETDAIIIPILQKEKLQSRCVK